MDELPNLARRGAVPRQLTCADGCRIIWGILGNGFAVLTAFFQEMAMKRKVVSLDGTWSVVFDDDNVGKQRKFFQKMPKGQPIQVPGVWEEVRPLYDGVGWYTRDFQVEAAWLEHVVRLRFAAVNYFAEVYVNGRKVGQHEGGYTPFEFDVTAQLTPGKNTVAVRVIDPPRRQEIEGFRSGAPLSHSDIPTWKAGWYWNFGGLWQSVDLIITPKVYIDNVFVEPLPDQRTAKVHVTVAAKSAAKVRVAAVVGPWKGGEAETGGSADKLATVKRGQTVVTLVVKIKNMQLWDTENPFLYTAGVALAAGTGDDAMTARFGMRTFTVKDGHFVLNGKRVVLKGFLQQGAYPEKLAYPPTKEILRKELELTKKNHMNFIRLHLKPDPFTPVLADEMGILLCAEPPAGWVENTPNITRRCVHEVEGLVKRDRNHPSIIMWCMLNEIYHYWTFSNQERDRLRLAMSLRGRELDPTRLIGDNSGGCHEYEVCAGAMLPYQKKYVPLRDYHQYCQIPVTPETLEKRYRNVGAKGGPFYISEFGAFECPPDWDKTLAKYSAQAKRVGTDDYIQFKSFADSFKKRFIQAGLKDTFADSRAFGRAADEQCCEDVRAAVSAMRANVNMDGYALCQLADASGEIFGATDVWRQPKKYFTGFAEAAQTPWIVPHLPVRTVEPGQKVPLVLDCVNEHTVGKRYTAVVTVRAEDGGRTVQTLKREFVARGWVQNVLKADLAGPTRGGRYVVEAVLREGGRVRCTNSIRFTVVEQPAVENPLVAVSRPMPELTDALDAIGVEHYKTTNSTHWKRDPFLFVARDIQENGPWFESVQQISRMVRLGGVAILFEPRTPIFYDSLLPKVIRLMSPMRIIGYVRPHPITAGLPSGVLAWELADLRRGMQHVAEDVVAAGGRTIIGGIGSNMWTQPDIYNWTGLLDEVPVGRGKVILVGLKLMAYAKTNPAARRLMRNLVSYARASIKPGLDEYGVGRCIDPVTKP
jgi:hypothetical protein